MLAEFVVVGQFFADEQTAGEFKDELDISCQTDCDEGHVNTTHRVNILEQINVPRVTPGADFAFDILDDIREKVGDIFTLYKVEQPCLQVVVIGLNGLAKVRGSWELDEIMT